VVDWRMTSEEGVLRTPWFEVMLARVELPDGQSLDHYLFRLPPVVLTVMADEHDRVLLVWRYRFIPGTWGWELPSGLADPAEDLAAAAAREAVTETGWEPLDPAPLIQLQPLPGLADSVHHVFWSRRAQQRGEPGWETTRTEWLPLSDAAGLITSGQIRAASAAAALLHIQATRPPARTLQPVSTSLPPRLGFCPSVGSGTAKSSNPRFRAVWRRNKPVWRIQSREGDET
jgi:8-oxo-dGTP pyrophosphatase MutT (NUDIX family)